jgi:hypothetical protein
MLRWIGLLIAGVLLHMGLMAQTDSLALATEVAEFEHMALQGLTADKIGYFKPMAPTLADCRAVFKGGAADLVYAYCKGGPANAPALAEHYVDLKITHHTTAELRAQPEFLASNKRELRDHLLPGVRFYAISYLHPEGALHLRYFVKLGDRWVFFANPWEAFVTQD